MLYRHNKKEQDQLPAHTYEEAQKGKKKSSVLIQLSGWLRTLDMVLFFHRRIVSGIVSADLQ